MLCIEFGAQTNPGAVLEQSMHSVMEVDLATGPEETSSLTIDDQNNLFCRFPMNSV